MRDGVPISVGHVHLKVRELDPAIEFYEDVLKLVVMEREGRFAFLSWGEQHHDVALQAVGKRAPGPQPPHGIGMYHAAFEVTSAKDLRSVYERLVEANVPVTPVDHLISKALYFDDPDGNGLEVYLDTRDTRGPHWNGVNKSFDPMEL